MTGEGKNFYNDTVVMEQLTKAGAAIVRIESEFDLKESTFDDGKKDSRYTGLISAYKDKAHKVKEEYSWGMNHTTSDYMIETHGEETKDWIGKEIELELERQPVNGKMKNVIYPIGAQKPMINK